MLVFLDWECLESPLPDVSARLVMTMVSADMRCQEPLHPSAEVAVARRPEHQMEVVRHQAIAQNSHREPIGRGPDQFDECRVIVDLMEDLRPGIPSVEDMITVVGLRGSGSAWHDSIGRDERSEVKRKAECPLLLPLHLQGHLEYLKVPNMRRLARLLTTRTRQFIGQTLQQKVWIFTRLTQSNLAEVRLIPPTKFR